VLETRADWDRRSWNLVVTGSTPTTMEVRAAMSARDADDVWTLTCAVREELISWLQREHPYALPRVATAPAAVPPQRTSPDGHGFGPPAPRAHAGGTPTKG
jgi:hypothetical protein